MEQKFQIKKHKSSNANPSCLILNLDNEDSDEDDPYGVIMMTTMMTIMLMTMIMMMMQVTIVMMTVVMMTMQVTMWSHHAPR